MSVCLLSFYQAHCLVSVTVGHSGNERKKKTQLPMNQPKPKPVSLYRSVRNVGQQEPSHRKQSDPILYEYPSLLVVMCDPVMLKVLRLSARLSTPTIHPPVIPPYTGVGHSMFCSSLFVSIAQSCSQCRPPGKALSISGVEWYVHTLEVMMQLLPPLGVSPEMREFKDWTELKSKR